MAAKEYRKAPTGVEASGFGVLCTPKLLSVGVTERRCAVSLGLYYPVGMGPVRHGIERTDEFGASGCGGFFGRDWPGSWPGAK